MGGVPEEMVRSGDSTEETPITPMVAPLPALKHYRATLLIERDVTVNATDDDDFQNAVLQILEKEINPEKYRLVQVNSNSINVLWN